MKPGDLVRFLDWNNEEYRNYLSDPRAKRKIGILLEIGVDYCGHELRIISNDGMVLELHESVHVVVVIQ